MSRTVTIEPHQNRAQSAPGPGPCPTPTLVLGFGLAGEVIVPWSVIWLSDVLLFDVPTWALWPLFAGPAALAALTLLIRQSVHVAARWMARSRRPAPNARWSRLPAPS
jgi:hypothetical protein